VAKLLAPADAVTAVDGCFARLARGAVTGPPRFRVGLEEGTLNVMAAADRELGVAGLKSFASIEGRLAGVVLLFAFDRSELLAVVESELLGRLRTGGASAVAAGHLARAGARTLGVIGAGRQAEAQIACLRAVLPGLERVVVYARRRAALEELCARVGAEPAEYNREAAEQDVVVTATTSRDPVLRGEWLRPGALVCAVGANRLASRELDNEVLARASFVCCDSREQGRVEAGDLVEPVERGVLDWLEVHELAEVVGGGVSGRQDDADVVVFKSLGIAAEDLAVAVLVLERARESGLGVVI
jgi:ornithine cyclodeaminase/alanine dehydrogenase-like protein (mu-crystallin family)